MVRRRARSAGAGPPRGRGDSRRPGRTDTGKGARSGWRKWLFRLLAATVIPAAVLGALELALRLFGYGYPPGFLAEVPQHSTVTGNARFGWRFFPPSMSRTPVLFAFPARKASGTYRIFLLGGSAAAGTPDPAFHFGRILQAMLRHRYPATRFEVVNAAMTAINSHVVREIATDCAACQPDLFVVYMGHNEVVGPYGPGTAFAGFSGSLSTIRASIRAKSTRTGQLIGNLLRLGARDEPATGWRGMEMHSRARVGPDDPRLEDAYSHFRSNLSDICQAARDGSAQAIVCTVAANLRDCAPFASVHRADLTREDESRFRSLYDAGVPLESGGDAGGAIEKYTRAMEIDGRFADLHFRLARCLLSRGRPDAARKHFRLALDSDALRFRADSRINEAIRRFAADQAGRGVHLVDFERRLAEDPTVPHGLAGEELFYEHVHLRFEGNYALAAAVFEKVAAILPETVKAGASGPAAPPSIAQCAPLVAWTPWARHAGNRSILAMTRRPPFTNQLDHARDTARRQERLARLEKLITPDVLRQTHDAFSRAARRDPDDLLLRDAFALFLLDLRRYAEAAEQWRLVLQRVPDDPAVAANLGTALAKQEKFGEAVEQYLRSLRNRPGHPAVYANLGAVMRKQGKLDEATAWLDKALALDPGHAVAHVNLGDIFVRRQRYDEAAGHFAEALRTEPDHAEARKGLTFVLLRRQQGPGALASLERSLRARPSAAVHRVVADVLVKRGKPAEAIPHLTAVVRLEGDAEAHSQLAWALVRLGRDGEALEHFGRALRTSERWLPAIQGQAWLLATSAEPSIRNGARAEELATQACEMTRYRAPGPLEALAAALAEQGRFPQAVIAAEKALKLARDANADRIAEEIRARILLYRAGKAYRRAPRTTHPATGPSSRTAPQG
ncbi:MAG: tetratricopeptide repeat protein [Phycisphaerae bacterium]